MFKERIYKIWKQFTTELLVWHVENKLCSKNEYTKSESNSQHHKWDSQNQPYCVQRTNIQNLKAIHNSYEPFKGDEILCSKNEYTKSESNSQPFCDVERTARYCVQRTNIQNLKAIHNRLLYVLLRRILCSKNEYTKSESNSQHFTLLAVISANCVQRTNIQNLKAIHNCLVVRGSTVFIVFKERIYKIWKQFTTP